MDLIFDYHLRRLNYHFVIKFAGLKCWGNLLTLVSYRLLTGDVVIDHYHHLLCAMTMIDAVHIVGLVEQPVLDVVRMADQNPYYYRVGEKGGEVGMLLQLLQLFVAIWMHYLLLLMFVF